MCPRVVQGTRARENDISSYLSLSFFNPLETILAPSDRPAMSNTLSTNAGQRFQSTGRREEKKKLQSNLICWIWMSSLRAHFDYVHCTVQFYGRK